MTVEVTIGTLSPKGEPALLQLHRCPLIIAGDTGTGKTFAARLITDATATRHMPRYVFDRTGEWAKAGQITGTVSQAMPDGELQLPTPDAERRLVVYRTGSLQNDIDHPVEQALQGHIIARCVADQVPRITVHDDHYPPSLATTDLMLPENGPANLQSVAILNSLQLLESHVRPGGAAATVARCQVLLFRTRSPDAAAHAARVLPLTEPQAQVLRRLDRGHCFHFDPDLPEARIVRVEIPRNLAGRHDK